MKPPTDRRILIIDDNWSIHDDFAKIFAPRSESAISLDALEAALFDGPTVVDDTVRFAMTSAYQGESGLARVVEAHAEGAPFALAFVDMRMPPGWDGLETIERIWKVDPEIQIVICSAYSDHSWADFARLGKRDALLVIRKPFDTIEVLQCAHALTEKWNLARQARARMDSLEAAVAARTAELEEQIRQRDRIEVELRLVQKLESVGQLAAGIAHEINTPIQYVGDNLHFVREAVTDLVQMALEIGAAGEAHRAGPSAPLSAALHAIAARADLDDLAERIPNALTGIEQGVSRITKIVRAMKELSHPGPREAVETDINRALDNALLVTGSAYRLVADVETDFGALPPVSCYPSDLGQVFLNLIVNAAQAMESLGGRRGRLSIRTRATEGSALISIADTGGGIPEDIRDRIFDTFFTTKEVGKGTGQGLAISRAIIDRHGGTLTYESEVGVGTTFHVRIPIAA